MMCMDCSHQRKPIQKRPGGNSSSLELELSMSSTAVVVWVSATARDVVGSLVRLTLCGADAGSIVSQALFVVVFDHLGL